MHTTSRPTFLPTFYTFFYKTHLYIYNIKKYYILYLCYSISKQNPQKIMKNHYHQEQSEQLINTLALFTLKKKKIIFIINPKDLLLPTI